MVARAVSGDMNPAPPVTKMFFGSYSGRSVGSDIVTWLPFVVGAADSTLSGTEAEVADRAGEEGTEEDMGAAVAARRVAREGLIGVTGGVEEDKDGRRSMMAGGSEEGETSEKGDIASATGENAVAFAVEAEAAASKVGDGVGRGEEAAVVIGRSITRREVIR